MSKIDLTIVRAISDHIMNEYSGPISKIVISDMVEYFGLTEEEINRSLERVTENDSPSIIDNLVEQYYYGDLSESMRDHVLKAVMSWTHKEEVNDPNG